MSGLAGHLHSGTARRIAEALRQDEWLAAALRAGPALRPASYLDAALVTAHPGGQGGSSGARFAPAPAVPAGTALRHDLADSPFLNRLDANAFQPNKGSTNYSDAFVAKMTAAGGLAYSSYLGGLNGDGGNGIAVDQAGEAWVTGSTYSTDFPTVNPLQGYGGGGNGEAFLTKVSATGSSLLFSTPLGGGGGDDGFGVALDSSGNAYVAGQTASTDFPITAGAFQTTKASAGTGLDAFVTEIAASGANEVFSTYLGGSGDDTARSIAVDSLGYVDVTGWTYSTDFPLRDPYQSLNTGNEVFVTRFNPSGAGLSYSTYLGGGNDHGFGVAVDSKDNTYVTGFTGTAAFPTLNAYQPVFGGQTDAFVTKFTVPSAVVPDFCGCDELIRTPGGAQGDDPMANGFSAGGVRYYDGAVKLPGTDLQAGGFGMNWGLTRSWSDVPGATPNPLNGSGWVDSQLPYLVEENGTDTLALVSTDSNARYFDSNGSGGYQERFFLLDTLTYNAGASEYDFTDPAGDVIRFSDFTSGVPVNQRGQFKSYTDPDGNVTSVVSRTTDGKPTEVQRSTTTGGTTTTESYLYSYVTTGVNAGLMASAVLRRQVNGGAWSTVRQAQYTYYSGTEPFGNAGDLKTVAVQDASSNTLDTTYYRYYMGGGNGYAHGLKYVFNPDSYARLTAALGTNLSLLMDAQVAPYADNYFEYDGSQRVTREDVQGAGASTGSGLGTYTYSYTASNNPNGYNSWQVKTTETLPDGNQNIVYTNSYGEPMLKVYVDQSSGNQWLTFYKYDTQGRLILTAQPSAVTGYNDTYADLLHNQNGTYQYLNNTSGLIQLSDFYTTTTATETSAGGVAGYAQDSKIEQGQQGTPILQDSVQYFAHTANGETVAPVASTTVYRNTDGTGAETTSYSYTWFTGTVQMQSEAVSMPVISAAENGPGTADVTPTFFDTYGRTIWQQDPDGFLTYTAYDPATGAAVETIDDVNTANSSDFTGLPAGWSTPSGGGLNLVTAMQVDSLGRTTKETDPDGNVTYTVYNDTNYEVLVYPGWNSTTNMPTGPTQVSRQDRPGSYTETLTMSATPHLTNGVPDGTETIGGIQSLSRQYTDSAGQLVREDDYFNLSGVTYSTATYIGIQNTNYYSVLYGYDADGRQTRVQHPTGTIERTVYDGLGRVVSTWVGTNDTPASGTWSPTNNTAPSNMVQVTGEVYDGGGVGDSNLTQETQYPGGSAAARVTQNWYDWRDRLMASKQGVQSNEDTTTHRPITYTTLDNLGEATEVQQYDGDGVTLTTSNGVPQPPSASLLRAQTETSYDDQGRAYQTQVFSVNSSTGAVSSTALTTDDWFNHRGLQMKESDPGGVVIKTAYDGAGRQTVQYTTDGAGDAAPGQPNNWANAGTVSTTNNVLEQVETTYDADGNTILTVTRQRFHNETAGGPLGNPTIAPKARVSYTADYYDLADRLTTTVDVGTNGGVAWTRPSTPPAPSDTVLVTSTGYAADSVQQVQLTGGPTGGTFTLSFNGQTTAGVAYNASAATVQAALQALSTIGTGNALVAGAAGGPWNVRFSGTLGGSVQVALTANGSGLTGGNSPSVAVTVTSEGGDAGRVQQTTDPRGIVSKTDDDWLGQTLRTIQAFTAFAPSNSADQTTQYTYDGDGNEITVSAIEPGGAAETTQNIYGVTTATGSTVNSNDMMAAIQYPDPTTGQPSSSQQETYTVNALGQNLTYTDRDGNVHAYSYDVLGRQTADAVTALGAGVDGSVRRLETAYDTQGNAYLFTSFDAAVGGNIVNQVQRAFDGLGQLTQEWQSHSGVVNTSTTPSAQYAYTEMSSGQNNNRQVSLTYSNGRVLDYNYNTGLDSSISRLSSISDSSGTLESYLYLGLGTVVERDHPQTGVNLTYIQQPGDNQSINDGGDQYVGLDRFGRVIDQNWYSPAAGQSTDRFQYGYDQDGNVLYKNNLVNPAFSELYHTSGAGNGYDPLNQLTAFERGVLSASPGGGGVLDTVASPSESESWTYDALGNWLSVTTNGTTQTRSANQQNEITSISGATTPGYDADGNTTTDQSGNTLVYDAWKRLVVYKNGTTTLETNQYDALGRLIVQNPGAVVDLYYSSDWQVLEERSGGITQTQFAWSPVYVDALVERDQGSVRLYAQQDANWNVTAVANTSGVILERYAYDPFGSDSVLSPAWVMQSGSSYGWIYLHQGGRFDAIIGLYNFRHRDYSSALGRWTSQDPLGLDGNDTNLYRYAGNRTVCVVDPTGLKYEPMTAKEFWNLADSLGVTKGLKRGTAAYNRGIGAAFEKVTLLSLFGTVKAKNMRLFNTSNIRKAHRWVIPEAALPIPGFGKKPEVLRDSVFMDSKIRDGSISLSYEDYQIKGYIWWFGKYAGAARLSRVHPVLHLVTVIDTEIGDDVVRYANANEVVLVQSIMEYNAVSCKLRVGPPDVLNPHLLGLMFAAHGVPILSGPGKGVDQGAMKP